MREKLPGLKDNSIDFAARKPDIEDQAVVYLGASAADYSADLTERAALFIAKSMIARAADLIEGLYKI